MKKLNNKGFTLIELLAVVVILAVVMGIAMTNVLSAMNKARGGSLSDSATSIAQAFNTKYTESLVDGVPNDVYSDVTNFNGYNFQSDAIYYIESMLADTFKISSGAYDVSGTNTVTDGVMAKIAANATVSQSFVKFDVSTAKFTVCMFANKSGSYYVDNFKITSSSPANKQNIGSTGLKAATDSMYACSDGSKSW